MWIKVREYADLNKVSVPVVHKRIKRNKLKHKKVNGMYYIQVQDNHTPQVEQITNNGDEQYNNAVKRRVELDNELKTQKLRNLKADTALKRQKQTLIKQKYRREFAQGVFECFSESFSDVKTVFVQMQLNKELNSKLKEAFKKSIKKFQQQLIKYLEAKDKEDEQVIQ